jgi:hypothetical protein
MPASEFSATLSPVLDAQPRAVPRTLGAHMAVIVAILRKLAPYAAILIMPGGSVMAVLLWLYRRQKRTAPLAAGLRAD